MSLPKLELISHPLCLFESFVLNRTLDYEASGGHRI